MLNKCLRCGSDGLHKSFHTYGINDSLWGIALKYTGVGGYWVDLISVNPEIKSEAQIKVGDIINIPENWMTIKKFGISGDRIKYGQTALTDLLINWKRYFQLNSVKSIIMLKNNQRLLSEQEVIEETSLHESLVTTLAIGSVLEARYQKIFPVFYYHEINVYFIKIGDLFFNTHAVNGRIFYQKNNENILTIKQLIDENKEYLKDEHIRLITGFCEQFNVSPPKEFRALI